MNRIRLLPLCVCLALAPAYAQELFILGPAPQLDPAKLEAMSAASLKSVVTSTPIATGSKIGVRNAYNALYAPAMPAMGFTGSVSGCAPGGISTTFKEWTISRVNYYRAMAGLPGNVTLSTATDTNQQSAAVVYSANQMLSHTVTNPPFTTCTGLLTAAQDAASNSNISLAFGSSAFDDVVTRYMDDQGNPDAGHRRWILYPPQANMDVGSTPTSSTTWGGNALRVIGGFGTRASTPNGIAWPNAGYVPIQVMPTTSGYWSYTYNGADFSSATVTMTANGSALGTTINSNNDLGFGDNSIVWSPASPAAAGTVYTVTVGNIASAPFSSITYTVKPFDATATIPGIGLDFNANGQSDVLFQNTNGSAAIWLMNGLTPATTTQIIGSNTGWSVVQVADFNGDGKSDLVWQHTDGRMAIYLMNGTVPSSTQQLLNAGPWTVVQTPDLDGDGKADLLFQNSDGSVAAWTMNGTTMTGGTTLIGPGTGWSVIKVADFDGDGKDDLLWKHTDGRHAIWLMNGLAVKQSTQILNAGGWTAVQVGDLDGDGKADIVWQHTDGTIAVWLMNGATMTSGAGILGAASGWSVAKLGDFDGDGRQDIVFQHTDGRVAIYLMNGITPTATTQILNGGSGWNVQRILDLDGDGKADIVWQNTDGSIAAWLMNGTTMKSGAGLLGAASGWSVSTAGR